jgi:hypothetical protein
MAHDCSDTKSSTRRRFTSQPSDRALANGTSRSFASGNRKFESISLQRRESATNCTGGGLRWSPAAIHAPHWKAHQSADDQMPRTPSPGERATHPWLLTLTSLIVILLLSLGLWWAVWRPTPPAQQSCGF